MCNGSSRVACLLAALLLLCGNTTAQQTLDRLSAPRVILPSQSGQFQHLVDLDGDASPDVLGMRGATGSTYLELYQNAGDGSFNSVWSTTISWPQLTASDLDQLEVGDFDGDGLRDDFVIAIGRRVRFFIGNGTAAPTMLPDQLLLTPVRDLCVRDLDLDGIDDLLITTDSALMLARNPLSASPSFDATIPSGTLPFGDLLTIRLQNGDVALILGFFNWRYVSGVGLTPQPNFSSSIVVGSAAAGDIDGDGDEDGINFRDDGRYQVIRQGPNGLLTPEIWQINGPGSGQLVDLDGDGDLDIAGCSPEPGTPPTGPNFTKAEFQCCRNDGSGNFSAPLRAHALGAQRLAGVADLDGDGDLDLLAGRSVWFGEPNGRRFLNRPPTGSLDPVTNTNDLRFFDLDDDGDLDVNLNASSFYASDGRGHLSLRTRNFLGTAPPFPVGTNFTLGDWNLDGTTDLITTDGNTAYAAFNLGGGDFAWYPAPVASGALCGAFTGQTRTVDLDFDGDLDSIASDFGGTVTTTGNINIAFGNGLAGFTGGALITSSACMGTGDFDNDGLVDLVTRGSIFGSASGPLSIAQQIPGSGFAAGVTVDPQQPVGGTPLVADLDGDNDLDLMMFVAGQGHILLTNNGALSFTATTLVAAPTQGLANMAYAFTDLNGDGAPDILASPAPEAPNSAIVIESSPNGWVVTDTIHCLVPLHCADMDGDGDEDILTGGIAPIFERNLALDDPSVPFRHQYGTASPGSSTFLPILGASGDLREGGLATIRIRNGLGGSTAFLALSAFSTSIANYPVPGVHTFVDPLSPTTLLLPPMTLSGIPNIPGTGSFDFGFNVPFGIAGANIHSQAFILDAGAPTGISASQALHLRFAP